MLKLTGDRLYVAESPYIINVLEGIYLNNWQISIKRYLRLYSSRTYWAANAQFCDKISHVYVDILMLFYEIITHYAADFSSYNHSKNSSSRLYEIRLCMVPVCYYSI